MTETHRIDAETWGFGFPVTATVKVCLNRSLSIWLFDGLNPERSVHRLHYHGPLAGLSDGHVGRKALADWIMGGEVHPYNERAVACVENWIVERWLDHFATPS